VKIYLIVVLQTILFSGCASIVNGQTQVLSVKTLVDGVELNQAACTLVNNKGTWYLTSPGTVAVHRSYQDLNVTCKKEGMDPGIVAVKSSTKAMAYGNILFGGIIGAGVDTGTGAAYDYPPLIPVQMGQTSAFPITPAKHASKTEKAAPSGVGE
jgi:hypothetical protein